MALKTILLVKYWTSPLDTMYGITGYYTEILAYVRTIPVKCQLEHSKIHQLCGTTGSGNYLMDRKRWKINLISGYNVFMAFNTINMTYSRNCVLGYLCIVKYEGSEELYCGHLSPWNETWPSVTVTVILNLRTTNFEGTINIRYMVSRKRGILRRMLIESRDEEYTSYIRGKTGYRWSFYRMIVHIVARTRLDLVSFSRLGRDDNCCE